MRLLGTSTSGKKDVGMGLLVKPFYILYTTIPTSSFCAWFLALPSLHPSTCLAYLFV